MDNDYEYWKKESEKVVYSNAVRDIMKAWSKREEGIKKSDKEIDNRLKNIERIKKMNIIADPGNEKAEENTEETENTYVDAMVAMALVNGLDAIATDAEQVGNDRMDETNENNFE